MNMCQLLQHPTVHYLLCLQRKQQQQPLLHGGGGGDAADLSTKELCAQIRDDIRQLFASYCAASKTTCTDADTAAVVTPAGVPASITERPATTTTHPPDPDNPYSDWDPRHAPRNSYFQEAKRRALQEEAASITLRRWLTIRIFNRNFNRHLCSRTHTKQLCRGASSHAKELASTGRIMSPAAAPTIASTPPSPRMQPYPTAEETHAFRHRGLPLPTLPSKKQKRRKRYKRCIRPPPRNRKSSPTSSSTSRLTSLCEVTHPTEGCRHCPAFFHHLKDLETHLLHVHGETRCLDKVTSTVATAPVSSVDASPPNPCSPPSTPAQTSSTTHRSNSSNTNDLEQDRVPPTGETPPDSTDVAVLPQLPYPIKNVTDILSQLQSPPATPSRDTRRFPRLFRECCCYA